VRVQLLSAECFVAIWSHKSFLLPHEKRKISDKSSHTFFLFSDICSFSWCESKTIMIFHHVVSLFLKAAAFLLRPFRPEDLNGRTSYAMMAYTLLLWTMTSRLSLAQSASPGIFLPCQPLTCLPQPSAAIRPICVTRVKLFTQRLSHHMSAPVRVDGSLEWDTHTQTHTLSLGNPSSRLISMRQRV
jgi:hypothetical protein